MRGISEIQASGPKSTGVNAPTEAGPTAPRPTAPRGRRRRVAGGGDDFLRCAWRGIRAGAGFEGDMTATAISESPSLDSKNSPHHHENTSTSRSRRIRPFSLRKQCHSVGLHRCAQIGRSHPLDQFHDRSRFAPFPPGGMISRAISAGNMVSRQPRPDRSRRRRFDPHQPPNRRPDEQFAANHTANRVSGQAEYMAGRLGRPSARYFAFLEHAGPDAGSGRSRTPNHNGWPGLICTLWNICRTPASASTDGTRSSLPADTPPDKTSTSQPKPLAIRSASSRRIVASHSQGNRLGPHLPQLGRQHRLVRIANLSAVREPRSPAPVRRRSPARPTRGRR